MDCGICVACEYVCGGERWSTGWLGMKGKFEQCGFSIQISTPPGDIVMINKPHIRKVYDKMDVGILIGG